MLFRNDLILFLLRYITKFQDFLQSQDVDLRIVAGETIALMFEIGNCDPHSVCSSLNDFLFQIKKMLKINFILKRILDHMIAQI